MHFAYIYIILLIRLSKLKTELFHPDAPQQLLGEANFAGEIRNYRDEEIDKPQAVATP